MRGLINDILRVLIGWSIVWLGAWLHLRHLSGGG